MLGGGGCVEPRLASALSDVWRCSSESYSPSAVTVINDEKQRLKK